MMIPLPPTPVLTTERLVLRPLEQRDIPAVQRIFPQWEVVRLLHAGVPWPYPEDGAAVNMAECLDKRARGERFYWAITLKDGPDELIGRIDLWPGDETTRDSRGFWLDPQFHGRGLMTEAAEAVTAYAFETLGWDRLWLTNAKSNAASHRIKEKQGAVLVDVSPGHYVGGEDLRETWVLTRETWLARRSR